jgi:DNA-binding Lrp family transcriptional regulator
VDDTDRALIALLRNDARASVASLAKALGVARGTVQNRMGRLAANGTIVGYTVRLKPDVEDVRGAFMTVAVEGNRWTRSSRHSRGRGRCPLQHQRSLTSSRELRRQPRGF